MKLPNCLKNCRGGTELLIIVAIALISLILVGGFAPQDKNRQPVTQRDQTSDSDYQCCNLVDASGQCKLDDSESFTWKGDEYKLLKSNVAFVEGHIAPAPAPDDKTPGDKPVFLNTTDKIDHSEIPGCEKGKDLVIQSNKFPPCVGIPDDSVIYVCTDDCAQGTGKGTFDAYYRTRNLPIPEVISQCVKPNTTRTTRGEFVIVDEASAGAATDSLQLKKLNIKRVDGDKTPWLSPYCKPAIYLYPEEKTFVNVKVFPKGPLALTIPQYPATGWNVLASPNGRLDYFGSNLDYLYYEAQIPDYLIEQPQKGFVVKYSQLNSLFNEILPKLGLNTREASQFSSYWLKVLPESNFYFVGVVPQANLNEIAPLEINPSPTQLIRVTLYFQALDQPKDFQTPNLNLPLRNGFTVVEWGGIFKQQSTNLNFSCFM